MAISTKEGGGLPGEIKPVGKSQHHRKCYQPDYPPDLFVIGNKITQSELKKVDPLEELDKLRHEMITKLKDCVRETVFNIEALPNSSAHRFDRDWWMKTIVHLELAVNREQVKDSDLVERINLFRKDYTYIDFPRRKDPRGNNRRENGLDNKGGVIPVDYISGASLKEANSLICSVFRSAGYVPKYSPSNSTPATSKFSL